MDREQSHMWVGEAADYLGVSENLVRRWFDSGRLDGFKLFSGYRRISRESAETVRAELRGQGAR